MIRSSGRRSAASRAAVVESASTAAASRARTSAAASVSSSARVRAPFTRVSEATEVSPRVWTATWIRWSPRLGMVVARPAVAPTPTALSPGAPYRQQRSQAAIARRRAARAEPYDSCSPPRSASMALRTEGAIASRTTALAPGSVTRAGIAADPPPAVMITTRRPRAWSAARTGGASQGGGLVGAMGWKGNGRDPCGVGNGAGNGGRQAGFAGRGGRFSRRRLRPFTCSGCLPWQHSSPTGWAVDGVFRGGPAA